MVDAYRSAKAGMNKLGQGINAITDTMGLGAGEEQRDHLAVRIELCKCRNMIDLDRAVATFVIKDDVDPDSGSEPPRVQVLVFRSSQ